VVAMINDMGIQVCDEAPDSEALLMSETPAPVADEDAVEEAEAALSSVDAEFGRTTDPVRMYMREMGTVELLTREGEIEIAKRIEDGLKHMIQAISACPTTIAEILAIVDKVEKDEARIDELVDGLINPNEAEAAPAEEVVAEEEVEEEDSEEEDGDASGAEGYQSMLAAVGVSGRPTQHVASATIIHPKASVADGAATALVVAGRKHWPEIANSIGLREVMVIDDDGDVQLSKAMAQRVRFMGPAPRSVQVVDSV